MAIRLVEIPLDPFPQGKVQRPSGKDKRISTGKNYLVKIGKGWYAGRFGLQWYGWNFHGWGNAGMQLDMIEGPIYEIVEPQDPEESARELIGTIVPTSGYSA